MANRKHLDGGAEVIDHLRATPKKACSDQFYHIVMSIPAFLHPVGNVTLGKTDAVQARPPPMRDILEDNVSRYPRLT